MTKFEDGDRVIFTKGFREGEKGTILSMKNAKDSSFSIAGIPWYSIKMDRGYVISGQLDGDFEKLNSKSKNEKVMKYEVTAIVDGVVIEQRRFKTLEEAQKIESYWIDNSVRADTEVRIAKIR
jgi:ribosomal protein L24